MFFLLLASMRVYDSSNSGNRPHFTINVLNVAFIPIIFNQIAFFCHFGGIPPLKKTLKVPHLSVQFIVVWPQSCDSLAGGKWAFSQEIGWPFPFKYLKIGALASYQNP
jgi:hypothetical protein